MCVHSIVGALLKALTGLILEIDGDHSFWVAYDGDSRER
jgi:hypothetical protein